MEVSGAAKSVDSAMNLIGNKMQKMEKQIYPSFKKLVSMERDHEKVDNEYDSRQKREIDEDGFTILSGKQLKLIYGDEPIINKLSKMSPEEMDQQIENDIKAIANYDTKRHRRSIKDPILNLLFNNSHFTTLKPFAFRNRFNTTIFISVVTLSPQAFVQETIVPQGGVTAILSPRAFHGFIASPNFAMTRILSPVFARYDILSPRALIYKLMSPEVLVLELLTPKALSLRIMSPDFLLLQILSPSALSPRVHSSDNHALVVLSPSIANPSYQSEDKFRVKILSPSFF
uniref:Cupin type-1 domain-containing protein n=1 Tax=Rhabditophanes sp. KR3021 TaxID=114890 RepID=A0AC35UBL2_9BILA